MLPLMSGKKLPQAVLDIRTARGCTWNDSIPYRTQLFAGLKSHNVDIVESVA